jgi:hypothetical protein
MSKPVHPPGLTIPPGADELPSEDGVPWETNRHRLEMNLLCDALDRHLAARRPAPGLLHRRQHVLLLQPPPDPEGRQGTRRHHRAHLREHCGGGPRSEEACLCTPPRPRVLHLRPPDRRARGVPARHRQGDYRPATPTAHGRLASLALGLETGSWDGTYRGFSGPWLRWFHPSGEPVLLAEEAEVEERRLREEAERKLAEMIAELERHRG